jgi:hypothetical protein
MKAVIKKSGLEVFVREDITPQNNWNAGKIIKEHLKEITL